MLQLPVFTHVIPTSIVIKQDKPQDPPKPVAYVVREGDTLTSIASDQHTSPERLFSKNSDISDPNVINPGQTVSIPLEGEVLQDRPFPVTVIVPNSSVTADSSDSPRSYSYSGNTYFAGQCVWYVKNQLGWVQNGWGNASDWKYTSGHRVSATPVVGAVAWAVGYSHVGIVIGVSGNSVTVEEMNYRGAYIVDTRTAPISEFEYILP